MTADGPYRCPECARQWSRRPLTAKQADTLHYLKEHYAVTGYMPTLADIARRFGIGLPAVHGRLTQLARKHYIAKEAKWTRRGLTIVEP